MKAQSEDVEALKSISEICLFLICALGDVLLPLRTAPVVQPHIPAGRLAGDVSQKEALLHSLGVELLWRLPAMANAAESLHEIASENVAFAANA